MHQVCACGRFLLLEVQLKISISSCYLSLFWYLPLTYKLAYLSLQPWRFLETWEISAC
jgi:hypothetical protein